MFRGKKKKNGEIVTTLNGVTDQRALDRYLLFYTSTDTILGCTVQGSNPGLERDFPQPSRPALGPTQPPFTMSTGSLPVIKRPGCGVDHSPLLAPRLKKE
jgi:hypothetical protein